MSEYLFPRPKIAIPESLLVELYNAEQLHRKITDPDISEYEKKPLRSQLKKTNEFIAMWVRCALEIKIENHEQDAGHPLRARS